MLIEALRDRFAESLQRGVPFSENDHLWYQALNQALNEIYSLRAENEELHDSLEGLRARPSQWKYEKGQMQQRLLELEAEVDALQRQNRA